MFNYQQTGRYFAQAAGGVEELLGHELQALGAVNITPAFRGLFFDADQVALYRVNYMSRLAARILAPLLRFDCHSTKYLYKTARGIEWQQIFSTGQSFMVTATVDRSKITHSQYAALCLKDAIVDTFRELSGKRPSVDRAEPDVRFHLHMQNNKATIYLDTSGGSLHRRGYRKQSVEAPMQETLAAAIIAMSGWDGSKPLMDPMCGSGTLLCEALMHYCRIPAGYLRKRFGFEQLPDFDRQVWLPLKKEADMAIRELPAGTIIGSDASGEAIAAARANAGCLPHGDGIVFRKQRFQNIDRAADAVIVSNPPYGIRLGNDGEAAANIKEFGDFLKHRCTGSAAFLYFGNRELLKMIGLKPSWKKPLKNGALDGVLAMYEMY